MNGKLVRNLRVEPDAGHVEEEPPLDLAGVDDALGTIEGDGERLRNVAGDRQLTRQSVAGPARDDGQGNVAERELAGHLVDRPIATPGDDERRPIGERLAREPRPVTALLGHEHTPVETARGERRLRVGNPPPRELRPSSGAGDGIDDDGDADGSYFFTWRRTVGGRNQVSDAARLEVRLPRSIRQIPPFLKGSARPAPIRWA